MNDHPEFEDLSAFVDGEAPQWLDHVDSCPACRAEVDRLRVVIAVVGQPVPPVTAATKERALSLALDALDPLGRPVAADSGAGAAVSDLRGGNSDVRPLPLPNAETHPAAAVTPPAPRWGVKGPWLALGSVAAVLLVVVLGAAMLRSPGGEGGDNQTLASGAPDAAERATAPPDHSGDRSASAGAGGVTGSDLGPVDDAAQLAAKAGGALGRHAESSKDAASAPAPTSAALSPAREDSGLGRTAVGTRPCEEQVRAGRPQLGPVVYFAPATSHGRPAFVIGFAAGTDPAPVTLLAVAQEGCVVLVEAALP